MDSRNAFWLLLILLLAVFAPSVLWGIGQFLLYLILGIVVLFAIFFFTLRRRVRRMQKESGGQGAGQQRPGREGEVKVHNVQGQEKRIRRDVGDYVEFEEITEE